MSEMPWDRFKPEEPEEELPYTPPPEVVDPEPEPPPDPTEEYVPPPPKPIPVTPADPDDVKDLAHDLMGQALEYAKAVFEAAKKGQDVDVLHPTVTAVTEKGKQLIVADAKSRSWRTLVQGLIFDLFAAFVAAVAMLSGLDPMRKETWLLFGALLVKSFVAAGISYFMRLKVTPTIKVPTERMAVMPIPRPILEDKDGA